MQKQTEDLLSKESNKLGPTTALNKFKELSVSPTSKKENSSDKGKGEASEETLKRIQSRPHVFQNDEEESKIKLMGIGNNFADDEERLVFPEEEVSVSEEIETKPELKKRDKFGPDINESLEKSRNIPEELSTLIIPIAKKNPHANNNIPPKFSFFELFGDEHTKQSGKDLLKLLQKENIRNLYLDEKQDPTLVAVLSGNIYRGFRERVPKKPFNIAKNGLNITVTDATERTPYLTFAEKLVKAGVGLQKYQRTVFNITIIQAAILSGVEDMIKAVVSACKTHRIKINFNDVDIYGRNCGHYVALRGSFFRLNEPTVIDEHKYEGEAWDQTKQANVKVTNTRRNLPVKNGMTKIEASAIFNILNKGTCDYTVFDRFGETPLHTAVLNNSGDVIIELAKRAPEMIKDMDAKRKDNVSVKGLSILHLAVIEGVNAKTLLLIIDRYFTTKEEGCEDVRDLNGYDSHGFTALHYAIARGNLIAVLVLLAKGANINVESNAIAGAISPLAIAAQLAPKVVKIKGQDDPNVILECSTQIPNLVNRLKVYGANREMQRPITQEVITEFTGFLNNAETKHYLDLDMDLVKEVRFKKVTDGASFQEQAEAYCYLPLRLLAYILELKPNDPRSRSLKFKTLAAEQIVRTREQANLRTSDDAPKLITGYWEVQNYNYLFSDPEHPTAKHKMFHFSINEKFHVALRNAVNLISNYYAADGVISEYSKKKSKLQHPGRRFHTECAAIYRELQEAKTQEEAIVTLKSNLEDIMHKIETDRNILHGPMKSSALKRIGMAILAIQNSYTPGEEQDPNKYFGAN